MIGPRPFFLLLGRASVFWLGAIGLFSGAMIVAGITQPDERLGRYLDGVFIAAFGFPLIAGWLAGAVVQEFQHTTFALLLPGVRFRLASGFVTAGLIVILVVVGLIALTSSTVQNLSLYFVIGLGAYCLGGILIDPLSIWITSVNVIVVLFVIVDSLQVARIAGEHRWITALVCLAVGATCLSRLFARATFRRKPDRLTSFLPGRFSLEKSQQIERRRKAQAGPRRKAWCAGYLGNDPWRWVRAAVHEVHGTRGFTAVSRSFSRAWGLGVLVVLYAWLDKGEMGLGEAVARSIYDALFRSPHTPPFGEHGGPFQLVALVLSAAGAVTALFAPVSLHPAMNYPLSRQRHAQVRFRCGLVDGAIFLLIFAPFLYAIGHLMGWFVGYEPRFDFMPFFFRVLMITLILMPLAHGGRLQLLAASRRKSGNTMVGVIFGVTGFVLAVCFLTFVSPRAFGSPAVELAALAVVLLVSQLVYRQGLTNYFRTADLA